MLIVSDKILFWVNNETQINNSNSRAIQGSWSL